MDKASLDAFLRRRMTAADIILILVVLGVSIAAVLRAAHIGAVPVGSSAMVQVFQEKSLLRREPLLKDQIFFVFDGRMRVEIKGGRVRVADSDCPRKVCVHTGWISYPGQAIVCVPNRVIVEITSPEGQPASGQKMIEKIDAVAF